MSCAEARNSGVLRFLSAKSVLKGCEFTWRPEWIGKGRK